jgi:signal transduction histidine kinase
MARELHDGVVQELGWIRAAALRGVSGQELAAAADRALDEARRAVSALAAPADEPLADTLDRAVRAVADRHGLRLTLQLDTAADVQPPGRRADLVRVATEAVVNVARHADSGAVEVTLRPGLLRVRDGGAGFDPALAGNRGHGLVSMSERAEEMGAELSVTSAPGEGTTVEVVW